MITNTITTAAASRMRSLSAAEASPLTMSAGSAWRVEGSTCLAPVTAASSAFDAQIHATRLNGAPAVFGRDAYVGSKQGRPPRGTPR